jgi:hypothetical protein
MPDYSKELRRLLSSVGVRPTELAQQLQVTRGYVSFVMNGQEHVSPKQFRRILVAVKVIVERKHRHLVARQRELAVRMSEAASGAAKAHRERSGKRGGGEHGKPRTS